MDDSHDGPYAREPQLDDLVRLARSLNAHAVRYVLIGGFAVIAHGSARTTKDIDLLIDPAPANVAGADRRDHGAVARVAAQLGPQTP